MYGVAEGIGWVLPAFGAVFGIMGLTSALYRMELVLDLARRRYRWRRGYLHSVEEGDGPLEDFREVVLEKELERDGSVDEWEVNLVLEGWERPVEVAQSESEAPAREEAASLASRLDVPLSEVTDA